MKPYVKAWNKFLLNEDLLKSYRSELEFDENGSVILYHISSDKNIATLEPSSAIKNLKSYTKSEYRSWDRPRVFFFTKWGQSDAGIGKIQGIPYKALIDPDKLYPVHRDPLKYSYPGKKEEYLEIRKDRDKKPDYYPVNPYEMVASLAERDGYIGFIYRQAEGKGLIVAIWTQIEVEKVEKDFY
jgi:hypothetical protein